ncbi:calcium-dependent protein kinase 28 isoform X2, partial [Sesbania bispinosa]
HTGLRGSIDPLLEEADIDKDGKISLVGARLVVFQRAEISQDVRVVEFLKLSSVDYAEALEIIIYYADFTHICSDNL